MKPIKKNLAIFYSVLIAVILVVAAIFTFIPMKWGNKTYNSFLGDIGIANDLNGGYYAEYRIKGNPSESAINDSVESILNVLSGKGYSNASVYNKNNEALRIELGYPTGGRTSTDTVKLLTNIGVGKFELRSGTGDDVVKLFGSTGLKNINIKNYNASVMVYLEFNDVGKAKYEEIIKAGGTSPKIYIYMGDQMQTSFDAKDVSSYDSLPLTFTDVSSAEDFKLKVQLGSLPIELDSSLPEINTMSAALGKAKTDANPMSKGFLCSDAKLMAFIALIALMVIGLVYMIVRFKVLGLLNIIAFLAESIIMIFMLWAIPTIELSITSVLTLALGFILIEVNTMVLFTKIESERKLGKTISASLENAYKKSLPVNLVSSIVAIVIAAVLTLFTKTTLQVSGFIMIFASVLSLLASVAFLPLLVNIFEAFNKGNEKPYGKVGGKN